MSVIRLNRMMMRLVKDVNDIRSALRRVTVNLPLYDINNENTPDQITANQNNYVPGNYDVLRLSSSKTIIITGMKGGVKGRNLKLFNVGDNTIVLSHQNSDSDSNNRFKFRSGTASFIESGDTVEIYYDSTQMRWIESTQVFDFDIEWNNFSVASTFMNRVAWSPFLNLFVAPRGTSGLRTSPDGITWTTRTVPASIGWHGATWAEELGLFIVVGGAFGAGTVGERVITSPDGITWTTRTSAEGAVGDLWYDVVWSPDIPLLVAVGNDTDGAECVMTSPDGITWTARTVPVDQTYKRVVWGSAAGVFVTIGSNRILSSPDGITWTLRDSSDSREGLAWSEELSLFIAIRDVIYTSPDGITWSEITAPNANVRVCVDWSKAFNLFVAVGDTDTIWSSDATTWSVGDPPSGSMKDIIWVEKLVEFLAVGINSTAITPK